MENVQTLTYNSITLISICKDYLQLTKFTLSFTVVFIAALCYLLAPAVITFNLKMFLLFVFGSYLITGAANAINQALEAESDALMKRTSTKPIVQGRITKTNAYFFAFISAITGVSIFCYNFNISSGLLALFSFIVYSYVYTPLKKYSHVSVLVGGIAGGLPCLIGWVAGNDDFSLGGWGLFFIQFIWQFPHFWAIAWVLHNDYSLAGFKLLPNNGAPTKSTALQSILYTTLLFPSSFLVFKAHVSGYYSQFFVLFCNFFLLVQCVRLYISMDTKSAKRVMFSSYIYLPLVYFSFLLDKVVKY